MSSKLVRIGLVALSTGSLAWGTGAFAGETAAATGPGRDRAAQERGERAGKMAGDRFHEFLKDLNLTEAQKASIRELAAAMHTERESGMKRCQALEDELFTLFRDKSLNEERALDLGRQLGAQRVQNRILLHRFLEKIEPLLDAPQKIKLEAFRRDQLNRLEELRNERHERQDERLEKREPGPRHQSARRTGKADAPGSAPQADF